MFFGTFIFYNICTFFSKKYYVACCSTCQQYFLIHYTKTKFDDLSMQFLLVDRYGDAYSDAYGNSPHSHHSSHYDSSPPFQTVPGSGVQTPDHWSPNGGSGVTSTTTGGSSGSGANTPVDIQLGSSHHIPHPAYLSHSHHREQYQTHHHPHISNGDIKPVIPPSMLGGYSGTYLMS